MSTRLMTADGWRTTGVAALWGAACLGVLRLQYLSYDFGHGICGPWGCGPPVQALLACHGFWAVNLAALLWVNHNWLNAAWERRLANLGIAIALIGLVGVAAHQMLFWYPQVTTDVRKYVVQRYLFSVATTVDAPLVQLAIFGLAGRRLVRKRAALANEPYRRWSGVTAGDETPDAVSRLDSAAQSVMPDRVIPQD